MIVCMYVTKIPLFLTCVNYDYTDTCIVIALYKTSTVSEWATIRS